MWEPWCHTTKSLGNAKPDTNSEIAGKDQPLNVLGWHQTFYQKRKRIGNPNVRIYNQDVGMEFAIDKCAILVMKSGKRHITESNYYIK